MHNEAILIFTKPPIPYQVKTRLLPALDAESAAHIAATLFTYTLATTLTMSHCDIRLYIADNILHPFFTPYHQYPHISYHLQRGQHLGDRLKQAVTETFLIYDRVLIIGTDCPIMTADYLSLARKSLRDQADIVLGPADDGGYVLLAMNSAYLSLFDNIPWSTNAVFSETIERVNALNHPYHQLPTLWDIDTPADLDKFKAWYLANHAEIKNTAAEAYYQKLLLFIP